MAIFPLLRLSALLIIHTPFLSVVFGYYSRNETTDIQALLEFKSNITSDPLHIMDLWNESTPLCQWYGVTCGRRHKRVKILDLSSSKITGTISPHVGNLSFLMGLILENNSFIGNIPPELGRLQRLRSLKLRNNSFFGTIPYNISNCYNLMILDLMGNYLEGEIPAEIGSLTKLFFLSLRRNNFHGHIPSSFGNLSALETLDLGENNLNGVLPNTLGHLHNLTWFGIRKNRISGSIPLSMYNIYSLSTFIVSDNLIHGSLPPELFNNLPNLRYFLITKNQITGNIPISLSNASNLVWFGTSENNFVGKIPSLEKLHNLVSFEVFHNHHGNGGIGDLDFLCSLTNNTNLEDLSITQNNFGGTLPKCIGNLSSLVDLFMGENSIFGSIPIEMGNLINLETLMIYENHLSGEIPSSIGYLEKLVKLDLDDNGLSGKIPSSLGNLMQLLGLSLTNNKLQGTIPHTLGKCKNLNVLHLDANDLVGSIPLEIFQISSLIDMNMAQNRLHGPLSELVKNLENINYLDVSDNMLFGPIRSSLGECIKLQNLYMEGNFFEGMIPPSLGSLRGIDVIDLSRNNLSGQIPRSLAGLVFVENLNLSFNNFEGPMIEDGIFTNSSRFSIIGNEKLCGGIPELELPKCKHMKSSHNVVKVVLTVSIGLLGLSLLCLCVWLYHRSGNKRNIVSESSSNVPFLRLTYQSLFKATNGFSSTNKLGSGGFGSVYKANLDISETVVAVKVFDLQKYGASRSFLAECEVLKRTRHRNLVKVLTACSSIDFSGNEFKALVYEFMANGSLEDWLHPITTSECTNQTQKHLGLLQRLNIAIDVACALDYLHHQCEIPIIHRDVKPSNVLLDNEMIGHVGDYGLSKILLDGSDNTTSWTSSIGPNGTIGYIAPEYGMGASMSIQGDVYSFGVLLLELFTGKRPNDDIFQGSINLIYFVKAALPNKVIEIVDPTLHVEMEECSNAGNSVLEYLIAIFEIGVSCSAFTPMERKSMKDVVAELQFVRRNILANQTHECR